MKHIIISIFALILFAAPCSAITNSMSSVQLAWNASPTANMGVITYELYYGPASATYTNWFSVGPNLTGSVSNLVRGSTYFFAVTAVCATNNLQSEFSNEISWTSPAPPTPPTTFKIISGS
jgi:Fibronectin type III domain